MLGHKFTVSSVRELTDVIENITTSRELNPGTPLWYRGHQHADYVLLPTLLRKSDADYEINRNSTYSTVNLQEDYRLQNFKARVFHLIDPIPENRIEWQALYQHHLGATRLLDWSESIWTALSFSLEAFLDARPRLDLNKIRTTITPVLWVLDPVALNKKVYEYFRDIGMQQPELVKKACSNLDLTLFQEQALDKQLQSARQQALPYRQPDISGKIESQGIINLGVLDEFRQRHMGELKGMLLSGEYNPYFYMYLRYYADALPVQVKDAQEQMMPPLAILHLYQSERIRAQRGTFTVFPNYYLESEAVKSKQWGYDCRIMENQMALQDCIYEIRLLNPRKITRELMAFGMRQSELYPESDCYTRTMEAEKYFV